MHDPVDGSRRRGRVLVLGFVGLVGLAVAYFALGMPGMDHGEPTGTEHAPMTDMPHEPEP